MLDSNRLKICFLLIILLQGCALFAIAYEDDYVDDYDQEYSDDYDEDYELAGQDDALLDAPAREMFGKDVDDLTDREYDQMMGAILGISPEKHREIVERGRL